MIKIVSALIVVVMFQSCDDNSLEAAPKSPLDSTGKASRLDTSGSKQTTKGVVVKGSFNELKNNVLGSWASLGMDNASFVIEKMKITYPETFTSYSYSIEKDSIRIKYDGYNGAYHVGFRGPDTLILAGDEEQVYYRVK